MKNAKLSDNLFRIGYQDQDQDQTPDPDLDQERSRSDELSEV